MLKPLFLFVILLSSSVAMPATLEKVTIPEKKEVAGKELFLNGIGIRRGTFLNIKVYVGGLYIPSKSQNIEAILKMPFPKQISMNFLRDVPKEETQEAWKEGFVAAVPKEKKKRLMKYLEELNSKMPNLKKKEVMIANFLDEGVEIIINDKQVATIGNKEFSEALFSIWFIEARDERLRDELLGKN